MKFTPVRIRNIVRTINLVPIIESIKSNLNWYHFASEGVVDTAYGGEFVSFAFDDDNKIQLFLKPHDVDFVQDFIRIEAPNEHKNENDVADKFNTFVKSHATMLDLPEDEEFLFIDNCSVIKDKLTTIYGSKCGMSYVTMSAILDTVLA